jgi:CRP-like cAMP-binding protein
MAATITPGTKQARYEDVFALLPASKTTAYDKGQTIYGLDTYPRNIYMVINGTVGIMHTADDGSAVLLDIVRPNDLFGESAFIAVSEHREGAKAIERTEVMAWAVSEMKELLTAQPRLAEVMLQVLAHRNALYARRIESLTIDSIDRRLARALLHLSERLGTQEEGGAVWMIPLTQRLLSQYIGTSREIISHHMNRFRRSGYVDYSRRAIRLHPKSLKSVLD